MPYSIASFTLGMTSAVYQQVGLVKVAEKHKAPCWHTDMVQADSAGQWAAAA